MKRGSAKRIHGGQDRSGDFSFGIGCAGSLPPRRITGLVEFHAGRRCNGSDIFERVGAFYVFRYR